MKDWIETHSSTDEDAGLIVKTEVLELPHGCLVRTTLVQGNDGRLRNGTTTVATATVFVPNLQLERQVDMANRHPLQNALAPAQYEFKHKP